MQISNDQTLLYGEHGYGLRICWFLNAVAYGAQAFRIESRQSDKFANVSITAASASTEVWAWCVQLSIFGMAGNNRAGVIVGNGIEVSWFLVRDTF